ncbi:MAG: AzlD domain-containing protein [Pseudomonadota bacterium]
MELWWLLLLMACITFLNRYLFITHLVSIKPGARLTRFLSYSSYAVLTAIWAPLVFTYQGGLNVGHMGWDYLLGATTAAVLTMLKVPSIWVVLISIAVFATLRFSVL